MTAYIIAAAVVVASFWAMGTGRTKRWGRRLGAAAADAWERRGKR